MKKLHVLVSCTLLSLVMLFSSCKKWNPWEEGEGGGGKPSVDICSKTGTLVKVPCGVSDLDNLWIRTDDGKYYQPCDASLLQTMDLAYPIEEGLRIRFGFSVLSGPSLCDNEYLVLCPQKIPAKVRIRLTCIQPVLRCGTEPQ